MIRLPIRGLAGLAFSLLAGFAAPAVAAEEVNVYTTREPGLIQPLFARFAETTGIKVNTIFVQQGLAERVATEGANSPADVLMVVDFGTLYDFVQRGLAQPVKSPALEAAIPANLRDADGRWYALSMRARVLYVSAERVKDQTLTYDDLADPRFKGRLCIRSGQHAYNTFLFAAHLVRHDAAATEAWLKGLKANLARKAGGGDRDVARDILAGICDVGVGNSYYVGLMRSGKGGPDQIKWGEAIRVIMPTFADGKGTHVNVSGAVVAKNAPNRANAVRLLEFLVSDEAQKLYADANFEYPVKPGIATDPVIAALGPLTVDPTPLVAITARRAEASLIVDKVGFDN